MKKITNPSYTLLHLVCFLFNSRNCLCSNDNSSNSSIILDSGFAGNSSFNGKIWVGDENLFPAEHYEGTTTGRVISNTTGGQVPENPYSTARFFASSLSYTFPMSPGLKFIRLHFYPATSYNVKQQISKAKFSVITSGNYTLLNNFSPSVMANALKSPYFAKDYFVNLYQPLLNITFAPSPYGFGFVNGIEIYPMPLKLSDYGANATSALEILYRINVGDTNSQNQPFWIGRYDELYMQGSRNGTPIGPYGDPIDYRKSSWTLSEYGAPGDLYSTARTIGGSDEAANVSYNLTWIFPVDSGFEYIVRLHFCEIQLNVTEKNHRVFKVRIFL